MKKQSQMNLLRLLTLSLAALGLCSCGGGGGSDSFVGAGRVMISSSPSHVDVGDRTLVTVDLSDINDDGVILKVRFPAALTYVKNTAFLEVDDLEKDIGPDINIDTDNVVFLVFFFRRSEFAEQNQGTLSFQLEGVTAVQDGEISVDIDVDDALIDNAVEFDPENPEFQVEDATGIRVEA
jgi:hypothetical protein